MMNRKCLGSKQQMLRETFVVKHVMSSLTACLHAAQHYNIKVAGGVKEMEGEHHVHLTQPTAKELM